MTWLPLPRRALLAAPFAAALLLLGCARAPSPSAANEAEALRVMTFNVRYGTANDGDDHWIHRAQHVMGVIESEAPALLAIQEALDFQADAILARCPDFVKVGQHREGGTKNEFSGMLVRSGKLVVEDSGDLWLSATPDVIGSVGWDAALTRNATWARLRLKDSGARFVAISTHFDHRGAQARVESARLLARELQRHCREGAAPGEPPLPGLLLGDLNAGEDSDPLKALREAGLTDTFRTACPLAQEVGTFNAFKDRLDGAKIDYVMATQDWTVRSAEILRPRSGDRSASDHDPVAATLTIP